MLHEHVMSSSGKQALGRAGRLDHVAPGPSFPGDLVSSSRRDGLNGPDCRAPRSSNRSVMGRKRRAGSAHRLPRSPGTYVATTSQVVASRPKGLAGGRGRFFSACLLCNTTKKSALPAPKGVMNLVDKRTKRYKFNLIFMKILFPTEERGAGLWWRTNAYYWVPRRSTCPP